MNRLQTERRIIIETIELFLLLLLMSIILQNSMNVTNILFVPKHLLIATEYY